MKVSSSRTKTTCTTEIISDRMLGRILGSSEKSKSLLLDSHKQAILLEEALHSKNAQIKELHKELTKLKHILRGKDGQITLLRFREGKLSHRRYTPVKALKKASCNEAVSPVVANSILKQRQSWLLHWQKAQPCLQQLRSKLMFAESSDQQDDLCTEQQRCNADNSPYVMSGNATSTCTASDCSGNGSSASTHSGSSSIFSGLSSGQRTVDRYSTHDTSSKLRCLISSESRIESTCGMNESINQLNRSCTPSSDASTQDILRVLVTKLSPKRQVKSPEVSKKLFNTTFLLQENDHCCNTTQKSPTSTDESPCSSTCTADSVDNRNTLSQTLSTVWSTLASSENAELSTLKSAEDSAIMRRNDGEALTCDQNASAMRSSKNCSQAANRMSDSGFEEKLTLSPIVLKIFGSERPQKQAQREAAKIADAAKPLLEVRKNESEAVCDKENIVNLGSAVFTKEEIDRHVLGTRTQMNTQEPESVPCAHNQRVGHARSSGSNALGDITKKMLSQSNTKNVVSIATQKHKAVSFEKTAHFRKDATRETGASSCISQTKSSMVDAEASPTLLQVQDASTAVSPSAKSMNSFITIQPAGSRASVSTKTMTLSSNSAARSVWKTGHDGYVGQSLSSLSPASFKNQLRQLREENENVRRDIDLYKAKLRGVRHF